MKFRYIFILFLLSIVQIHAQDVHTYTLKEVKVSGTNKFSSQQILRYTGLQLNQTIEIPSRQINSAIKKLWKTNLFSDIKVFEESTGNPDEVILVFYMVPLDDLGKLEVEGLSKGKVDKLKKENGIKDGMKVSRNTATKFQNSIERQYLEKGFPDVKANVVSVRNADNISQVDWKVKVDRGPRVKIKEINIEGNKELSDARLKRKGLKKTKKKNFFRFWKGSKFNKDKFDEDLVKIIDEYKSVGFRDAKITDTKVERLDDKNYGITIKVDEGKQYFLGDVNFIGNSEYSTEILNRYFGYTKGDIFDAVGISKKVSGSEKDDDIHSLYLNDGYLFSRVNMVEKAVHNDTIDVDVMIVEGSQARWNKVTFSGNINTYDRVIQRSLRTLPGELFSKLDIKRTFFDLAGMPYIEAQQITQDIVPNSENNTVDIHWGLTEKGASQIQLQGGYGAGRFIGTLGLSFGNFSLRNVFKKDKWKPIPVGDGQTLSIQAQAGSGYENYAVSFVEPWIGGKKPTSLSVSFYNTILNSTDSYGQDSRLGILGVSAGLNKLLTWPDNWFRLSQTISYQVYNFDNYAFNVGSVSLNNGSSNNLSYTIALNRNSQGSDPIFPEYGSEVGISLKLTPPYSLFEKKDYSTISDNEKYKLMEYYKVKLNAYWYQKLLGKSVIKVGGEMGFLNGYNSDLGAPPFERFFIGGTGLMGNRFDGREIIPLRGYQDASNSGGVSGSDITPKGGGSVYNKFLLELRYPITLSQSAKIYGLSFLEAGSAWDADQKYRPFELKRSAGVGIRIFMPAFGLLGFDFGYGFDKPMNSSKISGWQTHFIIGQQF
ncbi:MAG: outer membrane protein assembly factor BamA [Flavobacteriales bacterium]|nr:outer membrane protein assembly factor BamA [Flavobacteriales bacterium]